MKKNRISRKKGGDTPMTEKDLPLEETIPQAEEATPEEAPIPEVPQLREELTAATAKAEEYLALAQRVQADFDNFRRRNESVRVDAFADGQRQVVSALLPVVDNLERALEAAPEESSLRTGVDMTLRQTREILEKLGVSAIDRLGEKFDPNLENAVLQGSEDEGEPGCVCAVLQKGYRMNGHVLRHAMVKVVAD